MKRNFVLLLLVIGCSICQGQNFAPFSFFNQPIFQDSSIEPINGFSISVKENYKSLLRWRTGDSKEEDSFFSIERSFNGMDFSVIAVMKNKAGEWTEFLDEAAQKGRVYYRVRRTTPQSLSPAYSPILSVSLSGESFCKFYPNPVEKILIVRSDLAVDLQISDRYGKVVIITHLEGGLKLLDVSTLESGVYLITMVQRDSNRLVTEKLVKK